MCRRAEILLVPLLTMFLAVSCRFDASTPQGLGFSGQDAAADQAGGDGLIDAEGDTPTDTGMLDVPTDESGADLGPDTVSTEGLSPDACHCDDGIDCTIDSCVAGQCQHVPDDGLCPKESDCLSWQCVAEQGCVMTAHEGQPCSNPDLCALDPRCNDQGECVHDGIKPCPDEPCRVDGVCTPATGECSYTELDKVACDDANPCTSNEQCTKGECLGKFVPEQCKCSKTEDCAAYEDGNLCNGSLVCQAGLCLVDPASVVICPQSPSPCIEIFCHPETGECDDQLLGPETLCDDSNPCTKNDQCDGAGTCKGTTQQDGTTCNLDESLCTVEVCQSGKCQLKESVVCPELPQCVANLCQPKTGKCQGQAWPDGTACDDGDKCTKGESCSNGTCQGGIGVCVDCGKPEEAGHPCDDGIEDTFGDFCFNLKCAGWLDSTWSVSAGTKTGLTRVSSMPDLAHFAGLHDKGGTSPAVYFVKSSGDAKLQVTNSASELPFSDLDGPIAVGPPASLYYFTGGFFQGNSSFKNEVKKVCTDMGNQNRPISVAQRTYSMSPDGSKPGYSEFVAVGFEVSADVASQGSCLLALCGRNENSAWACTPIRPGDVQLGAGLVHPSATALWLPEEQGACSAPTPACFPGQGIIAAVGQDKALSGKSVKVVSIQFDQAVAKFSVKTLIEKDFAAGETAATIRSLRLDLAGNVYAAGTHGFLASRAVSSGKVTLFPKFASLGSGTPHYEGIYHNSNGFLLATNVIANKTDPQGKSYLEIRSGALAGPPSLLLDGGGAMPFFNPIYEIETCTDCASGMLGSLGITDLAAVKDHLGGTALPGQLPFILVLSATVPDPQTGLLRGHGLFLPL